MLIILGDRGKPENPQKNLSEKSEEPLTNLTHVQYLSKISKPFNAFATRYKLRANVLVEKSNTSAN